MSETSEIDAVIDKEGKLKWVIKPKQAEEDYDSVLEPADYLLQEDSTQWFLHNDLAINIKTSKDSVIISVYNDRGNPLGDVLLHEVLDANKSYDTKK